MRELGNEEISKRVVIKKVF